MLALKKILMLTMVLPLIAMSEPTLIKFAAHNDITLQSVPLDSIHVWNLTTETLVVLRGKTEYDLAGETSVSRARELPGDFNLSINYPNAFSDQTRFKVNVPRPETISFGVYNVLGQRLLENALTLNAGVHQVELRGAGLPAGVYFLKIQAGDISRTRKILKMGSVTSQAVSMRHAGQANSIPPLQKNATPGDRYQFIGFAAGFYPDTLDAESPRGGEHFQFQLLPVPPPDDVTSHWRGFNLLGMFSVEWANDGFVENDFEMIADLRFNFVRLPLDYRMFTTPGDWYDYDVAALSNIDDAVDWGREYGIHVCINLHRAPGYCVNPPGEALPPEQDVSLWDSKAAQEAFAAHWAMFAERYADVPAEDLSFNLVNEPAGVNGPDYVGAVQPAIDAIRAVSPERLILTDVVDWGNGDVDPLLFDQNLVISPHFYNPFQLTHYKASWAQGSDAWPEPVWPVFPMSNHFFGSWKSYLQTPLIINGDFPTGTKTSLLVHQVSTQAEMVMRADGRTVWQKTFEPGPGEGEWEEVIYREEWDAYQNIYNKTYTATLPEDASQLEIRMYNGDWLSFNQLSIEFPDGSGLTDLTVQPGITSWGVPQASYELSANGQLTLLQAPPDYADRFLLNGFLREWIDYKNAGVPVFVGEWGVYNKTTHDVTLAFMRDRLRAMQAAGLGWALWNFRGSFGVLDSGRDDVAYEDYRGHELDRDMLELLREFL